MFWPIFIAACVFWGTTLGGAADASSLNAAARIAQRVTVRIAARRHRRIDPRRDIAAGAGNKNVLGLADGNILRPHQVHHRDEHLARLCGRKLPHWRRRLSIELVEKRLDQRIERHTIPRQDCCR